MDQKRKLGELISMNSVRPGVIHIFEGEKITIGKDETNTNPIFDNRIADFHCSFQFQDGQVVLKNLTSQGTYLNKEKMGLDLECNLEHGDHIHLLCQKGKKVTEKHVIAYMFFKYQSKKRSARKSSKSKQPIIEQIGDNLICVICQDIYYEGVAVSPCGHVFCGYCLQGWENENNTCPICRVKMKNITKAFQINKIIQALIELNPEIEVKQKPANKYFLQGENDSQSESSSSSDGENERELQIQIQQLQMRIRSYDQFVSGVNRFLRNVEDIFSPFSPERTNHQPQNIQQNAQQNLQQNAQQGIRQNAQQNQQNGQVQNGQGQNRQAQNQQEQN